MTTNLQRLDSNIAERREALAAAELEIATATAARDEALFEGTAEALAKASANLVAKTDAAKAIQGQIDQYESARPEAKRRDSMPIWEGKKAILDEAKAARTALNKEPNKLQAQIRNLQDELDKMMKTLAPEIDAADAAFVKAWFDAEAVAEAVGQTMPAPPLYSLGHLFYREDIKRRPPSQFGVSRFNAYAPANEPVTREPVAASFNNPAYKKMVEDNTADLKARGKYVPTDIRDVDQRRPGRDVHDVERNAEAEAKARGGDPTKAVLQSASPTVRKGGDKSIARMQ